MINYSSLIMFANKINRPTSITLECVEQQKINTLQFNMYLTHVPDTQTQHSALGW